ncbi:MAG: penicillin acylase family protein [Blastocatellia bacterium]
MPSILAGSRFIALALISLLTWPLAFSQSPARGDLRARAQNALAQLSGTISLAGLQKPVTVLRDHWGIAHIYADTQEDMFFAQGFVAAQDRLWQMDLWRRTGEGKLAEILGEKAIERDRFARLLRYRGDMKAEYESYSSDAKQIIESFVRGVNACIESTRGKWPVEFELTGAEPGLWTPEVCLTRMAGYVMTRNATNELTRARLAREIGTEFVDAFVENDPPRKLTIPDGLDLNDLAGSENKILAGATAAAGAVTFNRDDGSNNWVVDGTMTASGKPLLANDPHRAIALPSLRYLVHLNGPGWNVIGAGEPSLPGVAAGHNERVGFGFTIVGIDQQDLYVEQTNPANPNEYRDRGQWTPMRVEHEQIRVKGKTEPVTIGLKFTKHGPVLYEDKAKHRAYALRWVGSEPGAAGYLASLTLNRVRNWNEFLKGMERWKVPSENLVYADVEGNIGWIAAGLTPVRKGWSGLMPVPGAAGAYEWQGFLPVRELPQSYNPAKHFIATANHNILPPGYNKELGYEWSAPFRFWRIRESLARPGAKFSSADFERLQHDDTSIPARELTGLLRNIKGAGADVQPYVEMLTSWDHRMRMDSAAAALYEIWQGGITAAVFKKHVPDQLWQVAGRGLSLAKTMAALKQPDKRWFGIEPEKARDEVLLKSLAAAAAEARRLLGDDAAKWRWGALHRARLTHPLAKDLAGLPGAELPAVERPGDANTVLASGGPNFSQNHGASFREILDPSDWDKSVATNVPGQSGQPGSPHYGDLLPLWAAGKYFPLLYSRAKIEAAAINKLTLAPLK